MTDSVESSVEVSAADLDDLDALHAELRGTPGLAVESVQAPTKPGEQGGVLEFLTVACSGGAITVFLEIIKAVVESRGTKFSLRIRRGRDRLDFEVTSENADEVLSVIRKVFGGS